MNGRFAPSPTGRLHLGNLRTALIGWLWARSTGGSFLLRFEDLDPAAIRQEHYQTQADDLIALGLEWDHNPIRQTDRIEIYRDVIRQFVASDAVYPCYCSRREVREATQAPNGPWSHGIYPGTCRSLSAGQRQAKEASGRQPALRLRAESISLGFNDLVSGHHTGIVDDFVVQRGDGTPAYNLVVMIDDLNDGIDLVVRADDLVDSTPRQLFVARTLRRPPPEYGHVPLVLNEAGDRLAKRDGAVTLPDRADLGQSSAEVLTMLAASLGLAEPDEPVTAQSLVPRFNPGALPTTPWRIPANAL